jgi:hypothetical protein
MIWKEVVATYWRYYPSSFLDHHHETVHYYSWCASRNSNGALLQYKSRLLPPQQSVMALLTCIREASVSNPDRDNEYPN